MLLYFLSSVEVAHVLDVWSAKHIKYKRRKILNLQYNIIDLGIKNNV